MTGRLQGWLALLRAPNLLTVPGDPIAGLMLAAVSAQSPVIASRAIAAAAASVLFYCGGLLHNDLCDLSQDSRERPERPLPSGAVTTRAARTAMLVFFAAGICVSTLVGEAGVVVAVALLAAIVLYNRFTKHLSLAGPINMGAARGLSLMLGAAVFGWAGLVSAAVVLSAGMLAAYIAAVTAIAAGETRPQTLGARRLAPLAAAICWLVGVNIVLQPYRIEIVAVLLVELLVIQQIRSAAGRLRGEASPGATMQAVGRFLHVLPAIQASLVGSAAIVLSQAGGIVAAAVLLAAWPVARILSRRFCAS